MMQKTERRDREAIAAFALFQHIGDFWGFGG